MPKIVDYEKRRKDIIQKALYVFAKNGYHSTRFSDIAKRCKMGRTSLYQYFKNKEDIFSNVVNHIMATLRVELQKILNSEELSCTAKLKKIVQRLGHKFSEKQNMMIILIDFKILLSREESELGQELKRYSKELRSAFENVLKKGIESGEIRQIDPGSMAATITVLVESIILKASFKGDVSMKEHLTNIDILLKSLQV